MSRCLLPFMLLASIFSTAAAAEIKTTLPPQTFKFNNFEIELQAEVSVDSIDVKGTKAIAHLTMLVRTDKEQLRKQLIRVSNAYLSKHPLNIHSLIVIKVDSLDIDVAKEGVRLMAGFETKGPAKGKQQLKLTLENKLIKQGVGEALLRIVPTSLNVKFSNPSWLLEGAVWAGFASEANIQKSLQSYLSSLVSQKKLQDMMPGVTVDDITLSEDGPSGSVLLSVKLDLDMNQDGIQKTLDTVLGPRRPITAGEVQTPRKPSVPIQKAKDTRAGI